MKPGFLGFVTVAGLLMFPALLQAQTQTLGIDWFKVSGGGGTSSNGQYSVSGTLGQHDAGSSMTGGTFSLTGGFWALFAVQSTNGPLLTISLASNNTVRVSWPLPSAGFVLEQNGDLGSANWSAPIEQVGDDGTNKFITVSPPTGTRFYRLRKP